MKKYYKIGCVLIAILCFAILLTGCSFREFEYTGDYPELWTAAVSSMLGQAHNIIFPTANASRAQITTHMIFLRADDYGRSIYYADWGAYGHFAILFQPDFSFDIDTGLLEITDLNNYQTELKLFMETNGWGTPLEN